MDKKEKEIQGKLLNQILKSKEDSQLIEIRKYEEFIRACVARTDAETRALATSKIK